MDVLRRNNVTVRGAGTATLVFAHGLGCDQTIWQLVSPRFEADYRVVRFDYVGCGASDRASYDDTRYGSLDGYAQDLLEVVAALDGPPPTIIAHSISGAISIIATSAHPERFARLVLLAPSPRFLDDPPDYRGGCTPGDIEDLMQLMDRNFTDWSSHFAGVVAPTEAGKRRVAESLAAMDRRVLRRFTAIALRCDVRALLERVPTPALVVQCSDDALVPRAVGELVAARMPHAEYTCIEVAGHCPHLTHPTLVERLIREYLAA